MSTDASDISSESESEEKAPLDLEVQVDSPSACERHVTVTIPRKDIDRYFKEAVDELAPKAEVAGFRPGRAPRKLVEARFQKQLADQVKGSLLMDVMTQVGEESEFSAISEPDFDFEAVEIPEEGPMAFEFDIEVRPDFDMPDWESLELETAVHEFTDEEVKKRTETLIAREGELVERDGPIEEGDVLDVDLTFMLDGKVLSKCGEQTLIVRETLSFMDGKAESFLEAVQGAKPGDTVETTVTISDGAENESLQGKEVQLTVKINDARFLKLPEMNEQFLQQLGGFESEDELHTLVRNEMERQFGYHQQQKLRKQITEKLTEGADWDLPPQLVKRQAQRELERAVMELQSSGFSNEMIRAHANSLRQNMTESTRTALKEHFILERIAEENNLEAEQGDFDREILMIAMQTNEPPRRVRARLEKRGQMDSLRNQIVERKAIELIQSKAKVTEVDAPPEEKKDTVYAIEHSIAGQHGAGEIPEAKYDNQAETDKTS